MRRLLLAFAASLLACDPGFDMLSMRVDQDEGGEVYLYCNGDIGNSEFLKSRVLSCFGYTCSSEYQPGSSECLSSETNPLLGTCVEQFFSCFQPSGACNADNKSWPDGHRIDVLDGSQSRAFFAPGAEEPCIIEEDFNAAGSFARLVRRR